MKRLFISLFFLVVLLNGLLIFTNLAQRYDECVRDMHVHSISLASKIRASTNRITRNCSNVTKVRPYSSDWGHTETEFGVWFPGIISATRGILRSDNWVMANVELSNRTSMILLFREPLDTTSSIYGYTVTATTDVSTLAISDYFMEREPSAPKDLVRCYDLINHTSNENPGSTASNK